MNITVYDVVATTLIIGIIETLKKAGLDTRFCPIVAMGLGVIIGMIFLSEGNLGRGILVGIACGLSSCGLYDVAKKAVG